MKVSLGMFTVYDAMQKDLADTIGRVAHLGYDGIGDVRRNSVSGRRTARHT